MAWCCATQAEQRLGEEVDRVAHYLDPATEPKIREVAERELIARHMRTIAEMEHSGIVAMIEDNKIDDLKRAYELFKRVTQPTSGLSVIREIMAAHVKARGTQLVQDDERNADPVQYVQGLLALRDKYETVITAAFSCDKQFYNALNQSFEYFVNLNQHSPEVRSVASRGEVGQVTSHGSCDVQIIADADSNRSVSAARRALARGVRSTSRCL